MKDALQPPESFKNLAIPRKRVADMGESQYRVYSSKKEFVLVNAENAQGAIAASGVKDPVRVLRHIPTQSNVLEFPMVAEAMGIAMVAEPVAVAVAEDVLGETGVAAEAVMENVVAEQPLAAEAEVVAVAEEGAVVDEGAALSNEEVEKLLQDKAEL